MLLSNYVTFMVYSFTHSLTHPPTRSLTHARTHPPTHSSGCRDDSPSGHGRGRDRQLRRVRQGSRCVGGLLSGKGQEVMSTCDTHWVHRCYKHKFYESWSYVEVVVIRDTQCGKSVELVIRIVSVQMWTTPPCINKSWLLCKIPFMWFMIRVKVFSHKLLGLGL